MRWFVVGIPCVCIMASCSGQPEKGTQGADKKAVVESPPRPLLPPIPNPEYVNWSQFKPGTVVTRKAVTISGGITVHGFEKSTLIELNPESMVVERQKTTERMDTGEKKVNEPARRTVMAQFSPPESIKPEKFALPSLAAKFVRDEAVEILGKKYQAKVYEWSESTDSEPLFITVWFSDEVPGRILKQNITVKSNSLSTTDEIISIDLK